MMEAMWKKDEGNGPQSAPTWALYSDAVNKFRTSAESFMAHLPLLNDAQVAYQKAISTSTDLRNRLDAGDEALRSVMAQLEQLVTDHYPVISTESGQNWREENRSKEKMKAWGLV